ncbi:glycoside hydrolase family 108 protein [Gracilimonas tropica]|uniref:glycoside hydrolase family 108 protein n=1 Tax=Gracilimonas tropica TaxID=454600 RepID=UPI00037182FB|nr:N-acetylmuramidase [Gracilimonas tropica]
MNILFEDILIDLLRREGGFVNDPADRGGATNLGITIGTLKEHGLDLDGDGDIDIDDVRAVHFGVAKKLYRDKYYQPARVSEVNPVLQPIYFDMVVNHGQRHAVRILQKAANACGHDLTVDGLIGPKTIEATKATDLNRVVAYRILFFAGIVHAKKSQEKFWFGWLKRSLEFWEDEQAA